MIEMLDLNFDVIKILMVFIEMKNWVLFLDRYDFDNIRLNAY